jgi:hypothetical protein
VAEHSTIHFSYRSKISIRGLLLKSLITSPRCRYSESAKQTEARVLMECLLPTKCRTSFDLVKAGFRVPYWRHVRTHKRYVQAVTVFVFTPTPPPLTSHFKYFGSSRLLLWRWGETVSSWDWPPPDDTWVNMEQRWNDSDRRKPKDSERNCPSATLCTANPTWTDPDSNPGLCGVNPETSRC